jgi:predicted DNA-binding transcriptional regulator AlpA
MKRDHQLEFFPEVTARGLAGRPPKVQPQRPVRSADRLAPATPADGGAPQTHGRAEHHPRRLRVAEAASYVGLSISFLNQARLRGSGPTFLKLGRAIRYDSRDLDTWLELRRTRSTSQPPAHTTPPHK